MTILKGGDRGGGGRPSTDQNVLWVRFPVAAGSSHTKDVKMGVIPACMILTIKKGPRNTTGRPGVSIM